MTGGSFSCESGCKFKLKKSEALHGSQAANSIRILPAFSGHILIQLFRNPRLVRILKGDDMANAMRQQKIEYLGGGQLISNAPGVFI
jgi:hypothetical protein